jgi:hypothetical protein
MRLSSMWLTLPFGLVAFVGCSRAVTSEECETLLERYTDKQIDQSHPSTSSRERSKFRQLVQLKSQLDPEFAACQQRVSRSQLECAMTAESADQIERCLL